jgi:hypothetical protein
MRKYIFILLPILFFGCITTKVSWKATKEKNSVEGYRKFLYSKPDKEEAFAAKLMLESLLFKHLLKSTDIASVVKFLKEFPKGRLKKDAEKLLIERRAKKAIKSGKVWPLIRFLHLHPISKLNKSIKLHLESSWFKKILKNPLSSNLKNYLNFFPKGKFYKRGRNLLSKMEYKKLGEDPDPMSLKIFSIGFANTKYGTLAKQRFDLFLNIEKLLSGDFKQFKTLKSKNINFSDNLVKIALHRHFSNAVKNLDYKKLNEICLISKFFKCDPIFIKGGKKWTKYSKKKKKQMLEFIKKADNWKPYAKFKSLIVSITSDDIRTIWIGLKSLAYLDSAKAFYLILSRIGSNDFVISYEAQRSLKLWWKRGVPGARQLANYEFRRIKKRMGEPSYLLRGLILAELLGKKDTILFHLKTIKNFEDYKLILLDAKVKHLKLFNFTTYFKVFSNYSNKLHMMFPRVIEKSTFRLARNIERRYYLLLQQMKNVKNIPVAYISRIKALIDNMKIIYKNWTEKLLKNKLTPSSLNEFEENIKIWEKNRIVYRNKLTSLKGDSGILWTTFFKKRTF